MPSDSIAGFLDKAQASRVLFPEQVEQLIRQPDIPQSDLLALCEYLEDRGVLTRFQSEMVREGRGHELTFAGYPLLDEIGPCPGGTAYKALHPSLRTPLVLRRLRGAALLPADTTGAFVARARSAAAIHHPNLVALLDAGFHQDEPYAATDPPAEATNLELLVKEIGPMPVFLAAEYGRQVASALRAGHERGSWHGDIRPVNLLIGPMMNKAGPGGVVKKRPAPNAAVRVAELGLVPIRPAATTAPPPLAALPYLPPERLDAPDYEFRGDLYGLGASLYYLLTGRPPFAGSTAQELLEKVRSTEPTPLALLRPDLPADFVELIARLMAKRADLRPATASDAEAELLKFGRPAPAPATVVETRKPAVVAIPEAAPVEEDVLEVDEATEEDVPAAVAVPEAENEWNDAMAFSTHHTDPAPPPRREKSPQDKAKTRLLLILGLILHITATTFCLLAFVFKAFDKSSESTPPPEKQQKAREPIRNPRDRPQP